MKLDSSLDLFSLYTEALEMAEMGVWQWDIDQNALSFDAGILKLYEIKECSEMHTIEDWISKLHDDDQKNARLMIQNSRQPDFKFDHQLRIKLPLGKYKYIRSKAKAIKNSEGQTIRLLGVSWDITIEVRSLMLKQSKLATLSQVTSSIAHEVNNPLSIIVGKTNLLKNKLTQKDFDSIKCNEYLISIEKNSERITQIIRSLNFFSRNSINDPLQKVSLLKLIYDVVEVMYDKFKSAGIDFIIVMSEKINYENHIEVRESEILQVFISLLNNAYDAVQHSKKKWVKVSVIENKIGYEISVTDSGGGVHPDVAAHMFEPFFTTKPTGAGTGLGLSISSQIMKSHGGRLDYNSAGTDTEFIIEIKK